MDPLELMIEALNDLPNTRFRRPVGGFKTTYELVVFFEGVRQLTAENRIEVEEKRNKAALSDQPYIYFVPSY